MDGRGPRRLWVIILAGGSGTRLSSLTRALYGHDVPKQFAVLAGEQTMLQVTVGRALALVPAGRIVVVVVQEHEDIARLQVAGWTALQLLVQPRNIDTGPGLVLPLACVRAQDPRGRIVVMPADHHVAVPAALTDTLDRATAVCGRVPQSITLLGAVADAADTEYGWIVPAAGPQRLGTWPVERFVEKPPLELAEALLAQGALWNTFIMVGEVDRLWSATATGLPEHAARISAAIDPRDPLSTRGLAAAYLDLPAANFSRAVLEGGAHDLAVMPLHGAGWSDWGTPRRVFESLQGSAEHDRLLARLAAPRPGAAHPLSSNEPRPTPARASELTAGRQRS